MLEVEETQYLSGTNAAVHCPLNQEQCTLVHTLLTITDHALLSVDDVSIRNKVNVLQNQPQSI